MEITFDKYYFMFSELLIIKLKCYAAIFHTMVFWDTNVFYYINLLQIN